MVFVQGLSYFKLERVHISQSLLLREIPQVRRLFGTSSEVRFL